MPINEITRDAEIAARDIDYVLVNEYTARMAEGDEFPPVDVVTDGQTYWLVDGWQRLEAASHNGIDVFKCSITKGDRRTGLLASVSTNSQHGLRRSHADKRRAVEKLLKDPEWVQWSDREIAPNVASQTISSASCGMTCAA